MNRVQIKYNLNSKYFFVNETSGQVFLINQLPIDNLNVVSFLQLKITAFSYYGSISQIDTISILSINNRPPVFLSNQRHFEIDDVCIYFCFIF